MIAGILHQGSGLGNQLHRYVATRSLAHQKGYDWGMVYNEDKSGKEEGFKGSSFMKLNLGMAIGNIDNFWKEKTIIENGVNISPYDPEFNFIEDNTIIDGEFQDEKYWKMYEKQLPDWLKVEEMEIPDDLCVIGFRGGEYSVFPDLFLPKEYWEEGINIMKGINPEMRFEVHTDDVETARSFFPEYEIIHDIGLNWRTARYAKYAIVANSSFFIFPRWIRNGMTIAPRYWARHNTKTWALPQNYYPRFMYI